MTAGRGELNFCPIRPRIIKWGGVLQGGSGATVACSAPLLWGLSPGQQSHQCSWRPCPAWHSLLVHAMCVHMRLRLQAGKSPGWAGQGLQGWRKASTLPAPFPAPCVLPGAATRRLMKREEAGQGLGQQETARGQCEAGGRRPSGRDRQCPHMGSRRNCPAPLGPEASSAAGSSLS